jgi:hypothetical protein
MTTITRPSMRGPQSSSASSSYVTYIVDENFTPTGYRVLTKYYDYYGESPWRTYVFAPECESANECIVSSDQYWAVRAHDRLVDKYWSRR